MKKVLWILGILAMTSYPFVVYAGLTHLAPRGLVLVIAVVAGLQFFSPLTFRGGTPRLTSVGILILLAICVWVANDSKYFLYYPVCVNSAMLLLFSLSLSQPKSIIEAMVEKSGKIPITPAIQDYLRRLTRIWCLFFALNGLIALWTVLFAPLSVWTLYNGFVAYLLMGCLFLGEIIYRKFRKRALEANG